MTWDIRYIWGFSYLDYSFDVLISWICNLGLYNWFYHTLLVNFLHAHVCLCSRHGFQYMLMTWIYWYTCVYPCTPFGICIIARWGVVTPLDPHVQITKLETCEFSQLLIRVAQQKRGSSANRLKPYPFRPHVRLSSSPYVTRQRPLYYSYLYIPLYSRIYAYRWCNILVILCLIWW